MTSNNTTNTTKSFTQKTLDGFRQNVVQEEAKLLEQEPNLSAETIKVAREALAAVHHRLDQTQEIYDRTPDNLSLGQMIEVRDHLNEKLSQVNKDLIEKRREKNNTADISTQPVNTKP